MEDLMHNFNKILDEKRDEIISLANRKKEKKVMDVNKLNIDISSTLHRINAAAEKKYKDSAKYKKKTDENK
jgi:hypothetical protein